MQSSANQAGFPLMAAVAGLVSATFVVDLFLPIGVAMGTCYIVPVLLSVRSHQRWFVLGTVSVSSILTITGFFLSAPGAPLWIGMTNRGLAIATIWIVAILALQHSACTAPLNL